MSKIKLLREELKELHAKYDNLDFAHLALQNDFNDQQELKNKSHFNNARLRKRIADLQKESLIEEIVGACEDPLVQKQMAYMLARVGCRPEAEEELATQVG